MTNAQIASALDEIAEVVAGDETAPFRAAAYRRAAATIRALPSPLAERYARGGPAALTDLPHVGPGIARALAELLEKGHLALLDRPGHAACERRLASLPGLGPVLAHRVHRRLGVHTLEELAAAAKDGRLSHVPGFAARRVRGVRAMLAGRAPRSPQNAGPPARPMLPVAELLDVDREYREQSARGALVRIAPRRFNPERTAWLPVLRTRRGGRHYTALFSNTARAHALGKTDDWVVLYVDDGRGEREVTVVTETRGALAGRRVIRGREDACAAYYEHRDHPSAVHATG